MNRNHFSFFLEGNSEDFSSYISYYGINMNTSFLVTKSFDDGLFNCWDYRVGSKSRQNS